MMRKWATCGDLDLSVAKLPRCKFRTAHRLNASISGQLRTYAVQPWCSRYTISKVVLKNESQEKNEKRWLLSGFKVFNPQFQLIEHMHAHLQLPMDNFNAIYLFGESTEPIPVHGEQGGNADYGGNAERMRNPEPSENDRALARKRHPDVLLEKTCRPDFWLFLI